MCLVIFRWFYTFCVTVSSLSSTITVCVQQSWVFCLHVSGHLVVRLLIFCCVCQTVWNHRSVCLVIFWSLRHNLCHCSVIYRLLSQSVSSSRRLFCLHGSSHLSVRFSLYMLNNLRLKKILCLIMCQVHITIFLVYW